MILLIGGGDFCHVFLIGGGEGAEAQRFFTAEARDTEEVRFSGDMKLRCNAAIVLLGSVEKDNFYSLTGSILDAAISVHKEMGPGLLEAVYQHCLAKELELRNISFETMVPVHLVYKGYDLDKDYIIDILVANEIVVELKAVEGILPVHEAQIISYLKLAHKRLGFLINFNLPLLKNGFRRFINGY